MNTFLRSASVLAFAAAAFAAQAQLIGTQATGSLRFGGNSINYFDPANAGVPAGYLNATQGTTVTVAEPAVEFGYRDSSNTDTVNLTTNTIVLTDVSPAGAGIDFTVTLTDAAFAGLTFTKTADTFLGGVTLTRVGNTLTFSVPQFASSPNTTFSATFVANPTPEPATMAALGLGALAFVRRRRK